MVTPHSIGRTGEATARAYLERKGLRFVAANWSCKTGEIDLIMRDGSTLVLVEVRLRSPTVYGEGFETVATNKRRKLILTAQYYQQKVGWWGDIRFDVVSIQHTPKKEPSIDHIEHAFSLS